MAHTPKSTFSLQLTKSENVAVELFTRRVKLTPLLRVCNGHCEIGLSSAWRDRTILVYAKIEVPESAADLVHGAPSAEDRSAEITFEGISRPVAREHTTRENARPIADPP